MRCPHCRKKISVTIPLSLWIEKKKLKLSLRRATFLAQHDRIPGAFKKGRVWYVPDDTKDPRLKSKPRKYPELKKDSKPRGKKSIKDEKRYNREYYLKVTRPKRDSERKAKNK